MSNILALQQELSHKTLTIKDIIGRADAAEGGPRSLTQDEVDTFDRLTKEVGKLKEQITAVEATNQRREQAEKLAAELERPAGRVTLPEQPANGVAAVAPAALTRVPATARRTGHLRAFRPRNGESPDAVDMKAYRAGLWVRAALFRDERAASKCYALGITLPSNVMGGNSNPDGGYLVPDELSEAIIVLREEYGVFRRNTRVWPMGSDTLMIPKWSGGVTIGSIGENPSAAITQGSPTFGQVQLVAKKCGGLTLLSSEIAEDAIIDLGDFVASEFAYGLALYEDQCAFIGDGTSTYMGINGLCNIFTGATISTLLKGAVAIPTVTHDLFTEVDAADIAALMAALPMYAKMNAKFYCSSVCQELVFSRLKAVAGGNNVQTLQGSTGDNWLGYPIVVSQVLPAVTTAINDSPMMFFGDLSKSSALGDRRQVRVFPSEHRYMDTDQIGIRATERLDIVHHSVGDATNAGAIVALIGSTS